MPALELGPTKPKPKNKYETTAAPVNKYEAAIAAMPDESANEPKLMGELAADWQGLSPERQQETYDQAGGEAGLVGTALSLPSMASGLKGALASTKALRHPIQWLAKSGMDALRAGMQATPEAAAVEAPVAAKAPQAVDFARKMTQGMSAAGREGRAATQGRIAMERGMANLQPEPLAPTPMSQGFAQAGAEAAQRGSGLAMEKGITQLSKPTTIDALKTILSRGGGFGAGKLGAVGAALAPPPLSNDTSAARQTALQGMQQGQGTSQLRQQLAMVYDSPTVEFVLAALPNRLPQ
jgi:hypothetical protein